jgi:amino-acid N-acetyltransferase
MRPGARRKAPCAEVLKGGLRTPVSTAVIYPRPPRSAAAALLEQAALPSSDLTDAHMEHFFYCGSATAPTGLVGLEFCEDAALLRSLVVCADRRGAGLGAALVAHAEAAARARGTRAIFLLTTTAEAFFAQLGYAGTARETAPPAIRSTREFSDICPASSAFMSKRL